MQSIRNASAQEIAEIAVMLLDAKLNWINGTTIPAERGILNYKSVCMRLFQALCFPGEQLTSPGFELPAGTVF